MLSRALTKAKKEGGKKVAINFQVPINLKEDFEKLCKKNEVSVTSMLIGLIETALEEAEGVYFELTPDALLTLHNRINTLDKEIDSYYIVEGSPGNERKIPRFYDYPPHEAEIEADELRQLELERDRLNIIFKAYKKGN